MRTAGVKQLVEKALGKLPQPYAEDVIDDVFLEIEHEPEFMVEYDGLCQQLGKTTVNAWGGYWIANTLGKTGVEQVLTKKGTLIQSYSRLTAAATPPSGKRKEPAALELMSAYYQEHKDKLPASVRNHRALIVEMLMAGLPVEEAFAMMPIEPAPTPAHGQRRR